jgi:hypothetical protein
MKTLFELILAGAFLIFCGSAFAEPVQVGWIETIHAPAAGYLLTRDGSQTTPAVLTPVYVNDLIEVTSPDAFVQVSLDGISTRIDRSNSPFLVTPPKPDSALTGLVTKLLGVLDLDREERFTVSAVSRGAFGIPALSAVAPRMLDRDSVYLSWHEGTPPYTVALKHLDDEAVFQQATVNDTFVRLDLTTPLPPDFIVALSDVHSEANYVVRLVEVNDLPDPPAGLRPDGTPGEQALYACWLYTAGDGAWGLEGLQRLAVLAEYGDPLAQAVIEKL